MMFADAESSAGLALAGFALVLCCATLACSLVPAIVAAVRGHPQTLAILVLCLFLGWTGLGWIVALIWACTAIEPRRRP